MKKRWAAGGMAGAQETRRTNSMVLEGVGMRDPTATRIMVDGDAINCYSGAAIPVKPESVIPRVVARTGKEGDGKFWVTYSKPKESMRLQPAVEERSRIEKQRRASEEVKADFGPYEATGVKEKLTARLGANITARIGEQLDDTTDEAASFREQQRANLERHHAKIQTIHEKLEGEKRRAGVLRADSDGWGRHPDVPRFPNQSTSSVFEREVIAELQETKKNQEELITELKIRIAVLENELKHSEQGKQTAIDESAVLARVLGSKLVSPASGSDNEELDDLKRKIKMLKRENAILWKRLETRSLLSRTTSSDSDDASSRFCNAPPRSRTRRGKVSVDDNKYGNPPIFTKDVKGKGKERAVGTDARERRVTFETLFPDSEPSSSTSTSNTHSTSVHPIHQSRRQSWGYHYTNEPQYTGKSAWDSSCGGSTLPHSPILAPTPLGNSPSPINLNIPHRVPSSYLLDLDVGISSLEDVLDGNGFPSPKLDSLAPELGIEEQKDMGERVGMGRERLLDREGPGIDVELDEHLKGMGKLENLPKPGVLKTGFEIEGSFRGREYDHLKQEAASNESIPRGPRDHARHSAPDYPNINARFGQRSTGPGTSFETPKDRSLDDDLWKSREEREDAIETHRQASGRDCRAVFPDFFRYGIRYTPSETDTNYLRTVIITNLPADIDVRELLTRVRGGDIVSAVLMNTIKITGSMSAMVQFLQECAAEDYAQYAQDHPVTFDDENQRAIVTILPTPTWPLSIPSVRRIREHNQTRCLAILDFPHYLSLSGLERDLAKGNGYRAAALIEVYISSTNTLHLEFSSVNAAGLSFGLLTTMLRYRGLEVCFERDPCACSLDELQLPIPPRPPMWPTHREPSPKFSHDDSFPSLDERNARLGESSSQRNRLAALSNQPIVIPSFSGKDLKSNSWADEMNDDFNESDDVETPVARPTFQLEVQCSSENQTMVPPNSPREGSAIPKVMSVEDFNHAMVSNTIRKPPIGLAGSKYASLVPSFQDRNPGESSRASTNPFNDLDSPTSISTQQDDNHTSSGPVINTEAIITSDSERSFSQTATRLLAQREGRSYLFPDVTAQAETPPRVNLSSLIDPSPPQYLNNCDTIGTKPSAPLALRQSPQLHDPIEIYTLTPSQRLTTLQAELQPFVDASTLDISEGAERTSYPSPDLTGKQYIPKGEWTVFEAETLMGLGSMGKGVYREMLMRAREVPETPQNLKTKAGGKVDAEIWAEKEGKGRGKEVDGEVPMSHPVTDIEKTSEEDPDATLSMELTTSKRKIVAKAVSPKRLFQSTSSDDTFTGYKEIANDGEKSFVLGRQTLDDPFWDGPCPAPQMLPKKQSSLHMPPKKKLKVTNPDEIDLDLDDDVEDGAEAKKEFTTRKPSFKNVDKKNTEEGLATPTQADKGKEKLLDVEGELEAGEVARDCEGLDELIADCTGI
jgi:hypothetical protein